MSGRTAIGHDVDGKVYMLHVDGKTDIEGATLYDMAAIMKDLGVINAINLDGGGSATLVVNGTVYGYPSDRCTNSTMKTCARAVSTIVCAHPPSCNPSCLNNGTCNWGSCICTYPWSGKRCDILNCGSANCTNGICSPLGCRCKSGWQSDQCDIPCPKNTWGPNCKYKCGCQRGSCSRTTGECSCPHGYYGTSCEFACPGGFYGPDCVETCSCPDSCFCHHVTGECSFYNPNPVGLPFAKCYLKDTIKKDNLKKFDEVSYHLYLTLFIIVCVVATLSMLLNIILMSKYCCVTNAAPKSSAYRGHGVTFHKPESSESNDENVTLFRDQYSMQSSYILASNSRSQYNPRYLSK